MEDFTLYRVYWKVALKHGWSRVPLIAAAGFFLIAVAAFLAVFGS
jgi:hypothetical protein